MEFWGGGATIRLQMLEFLLQFSGGIIGTI